MKIEINKEKNILRIDNSIELAATLDIQWKNKEVEATIFFMENGNNIWIKITTKKIYEDNWISTIQTRTINYNHSHPSEKFSIEGYISSFIEAKEWLKNNESEMYEDAKTLFE